MMGNYIGVKRNDESLFFKQKNLLLREKNKGRMRYYGITYVNFKKRIAIYFLQLLKSLILIYKIHLLN